MIWRFIPPRHSSGPEQLEADPSLIDNRQFQHRYNAACSAALAGCGQGKDDPRPDDAAKAKLRRQAHDWLGPNSPHGPRSSIPRGRHKGERRTTLQHWKEDADLAGIRDEKELAKLPEEERTLFKRLWNDVDQLLSRANGSK